MITEFGDDFEWDDNKADSNKRKHGISFDEAASAFTDPNNLILEDPQGHAERFLLIGMSDHFRVLYVIYAEVITKKRTRIISARVASKRECLIYTGEDES